MKLVFLDSFFSHLPHYGSPESLLASLPHTSQIFSLSSSSTSAPVGPSLVHTAHLPVPPPPHTQMHHPIMLFLLLEAFLGLSITHKQKSNLLLHKVCKAHLGLAFPTSSFSIFCLKFYVSSECSLCPEYMMLLGSSIPLLL